MLNYKILKSNIIKWSFICTISAAPSFVMAFKDKNSGFDVSAMILGVIIFIFIYGFITSTEFYVSLRKFNTIHKALRFSYVLKITMAMVAFPFTFFTYNKVDTIGMFFIFPDFVAGIMSYLLYTELFGKLNLSKNGSVADGNNSGDIGASFFDTLAITLIEGVILSLMILLFAITLSIILKIFRKCKLALKTKKA